MKVSPLAKLPTALAGAVSAVLLLGRATSADQVTGPPPDFKQPSFKRIMIVVLENEDEPNAIDQPFMKSLAARGAHFGSYRAITHPSQPNYIAMTAGGLHGVKDDRNVDLDVRHLGDLLEAKGLSWKVYADDNDGHDTGVEFADRWLGAAFGPLLEDPRFMKDMLFVVTFDESKHSGGNRIYAAFYGESVLAGTVSDHPWNHYSLLRTIEESFHLGTLGLNDQSADPISGIWR